MPGGNFLGDSEYEDITDSRTHGLKISAFDKGKINNMLKNSRGEEGAKDVERDGNGDDEGTLKTGKDSEMEEEIEGTPCYSIPLL